MEKCDTPGTMYSTGSSIEMILRCPCEASMDNNADSVVVLPDPVIPAMNTPPHADWVVSRNCSICHAV